MRSFEFLLPMASFGLGLLSLPACLSMCTKFEPEVQNTLVKIPIVLGLIDPDLQGLI